MLAPSGRATELAAGRRALKRLGREGTPLENVVALGPAVPVSRRSRLGVPIGVQANLELALTRDRFDVVHVHEPGVPSLSYLALRDTRGLAVATFHSAERLGYPPGQEAAREAPRPRRRTDRHEPRHCGSSRRALPGRLPNAAARGRSRAASSPCVRGSASSSSDRPDELPRLRAVFRALTGLPGWELVVLRTRSLAGRPYVPRAAARPGASSARPSTPRAGRPSSPARPASSLRRGEARASRSRPEPRASRSSTHPARRSSPSWSGQPSRASPRTRAGGTKASTAARRSAEPESFERLADELERLYGAVLRKRRQAAAPSADPLADRPIDPRRPAHAHGALARLRRAGRRPARPRGADRPRGDRDHGPQRLLGRRGGGRARARARAGGHPRRGGEDRRRAR